MDYFNPLKYDSYYHIYNRANANDDLFISNSCYSKFINKLEQNLLPVLRLYSYCLLKNHFHLIIKTRTESEILINSKLWSLEHDLEFKELDISRQFSNCFNGYAKWFNKTFDRHGSLFQERFRRIEITEEQKLKNLICYVNTNAQHHGFVNHFEDWDYSSYNELIGDQKSILERQDLFKIFNGRGQFIQFHSEYSRLKIEEKLWID